MEADASTKLTRNEGKARTPTPSLTETCLTRAVSSEAASSEAAVSAKPSQSWEVDLSGIRTQSLIHLPNWIFSGCGARTRGICRPDLPLPWAVMAPAVFVGDPMSKIPSQDVWPASLRWLWMSRHRPGGLTVRRTLKGSTFHSSRIVSHTENRFARKYRNWINLNKWNEWAGGRILNFIPLEFDLEMFFLDFIKQLIWPCLLRGLHSVTLTSPYRSDERSQFQEQRSGPSTVILP